MAKKGRIEVIWSILKDRYRDPDNELPVGWTKRSRRPSETFSNDQLPENDGEFIYLYESCDERMDFWYPMSLSDPDPRPH